MEPKKRVKPELLTEDQLYEKWYHDMLRASVSYMISFMKGNPGEVTPEESNRFRELWFDKMVDRNGAAWLTRLAMHKIKLETRAQKKLRKESKRKA